MKKILCALLCVLLITSVLPAVMGEETGENWPEYWATVACPNIADGLDLRAAPSKDADTLGRFYAGTLVHVLNSQSENGFVQVRVGRLEGYMLLEYLMRYNRNYEAPILFQTAYTRSASIPLRAEAKNGAERTGLIQGKVYVLGDIGDDWRYVMNERGAQGYVRTAELTNRQLEIEHGYLIPADGSDKITVYEDKELKKEKAVYFAGANVRVIGASKAGGWAEVDCDGVPLEEWAFDTVTGYVHLEDVTVFRQPWEVESRARKGVARQDMYLADSSVFIPAGASLAVVGETEDQYHAVYGSALAAMNVSGLVEKDSVDLTDEIADGGNPPRLGFALLPYEMKDRWPLDIPLLDRLNGEEDRYTDVFLAEIIGEGEGWLQVRQPGEPTFFVQREGCQIIDRLYPETKEAKENDTWIADEKDAGLWLLTVEEGKAAELTTVRAGEQDYCDAIFAGRPQNGAEYYAVYIAPGMEVNLTGEGVLTPVQENALPVILPYHPADTYNDQVLFTGSGRFFCDIQLPDQRNWFSYTVRPMEGAEESWLAITDLFNGLNGYTGSERIELTEETADPDGEANDDDPINEWFLDVAPGQFLELHNCVLEISYGNG